MSETSLSVSGLKKYYGNVKAVDGITFQVESGSVFGMLGPNGAGKTTTIETLIGLKEKDAGKVNILGFNPGIDSEQKKLKSRIGVQLQSPSLFPRLKVREIVNLFASFYPDPLAIDKVIKRVGLTKKSEEQVKSLSGGQKHRLAVGLAMVSNGDVIFLDEPTTGLDPQARRQLWDVIRQLKKEGVTVFLTTHYMDEAETLCDDLVIIDHGKIIAQGSPRTLINSYFKERAIEFRDPGFTDREMQKLKEKDIANRINFEQEEQHIILYTDDITYTMNQLLKFGESINKQIDDIMVRQATLEDVFLKLTGRGIR